MTDRPILFSAPMVRALLDGRKTQTRRILKPQPILGYTPCPIASEGVRFAKGDRLWAREAWAEVGSFDPGLIVYRADYPACVPRHFENVPPADEIRWKPGIHMHRARSRLTLTVTDVRVQRLQEVTEADCLAEGAPALRGIRRGLGDPLDGIMVAEPDRPHLQMTPRCWYRELWDTINGAGSWDANPWVVAVTFTVEKWNIDT